VIAPREDGGMAGADVGADTGDVAGPVLGNVCGPVFGAGLVTDGPVISTISALPSSCAGIIAPSA
jgi:outer membrane lipoprotein SlyB